MRNLKNRWVDFPTICTAGTAKLVDVQCKFMLKSNHKIISYGHFKFWHKYAPGEVIVLIQKFWFHHFISQLLLKLGFLNLTCLTNTKTIFPNWV